MITESCLSASGILYRRGRRLVLKGVKLALRTGEIVSLLGANGAGKTTLLKVMLGLERPTEGEVFLNGCPARDFRRRVLARHLAYVPQSHQPPFPYLVRDVVGLGRFPAVGLFGRIRSEDAEMVEVVLERLNIGHLAERAYNRLSGGERQLVMIARAMAQGASLLVMDEPLSNLDYGHQRRLLKLLQSLASSGYGVLVTTHHPEQAREASTRVATLVDGRIDMDGAPEAVITPANITRIYGQI